MKTVVSKQLKVNDAGYRNIVAISNEDEEVVFCDRINVSTYEPVKIEIYLVARSMVRELRAGKTLAQASVYGESVIPLVIIDEPFLDEEVVPLKTILTKGGVLDVIKQEDEIELNQDDVLLVRVFTVRSNTEVSVNALFSSPPSKVMRTAEEEEELVDKRESEGEFVEPDLEKTVTIKEDESGFGR